MEIHSIYYIDEPNKGGKERVRRERERKKEEVRIRPCTQLSRFLFCGGEQKQTPGRESQLLEVVQRNLLLMTSESFTHTTHND